MIASAELGWTKGQDGPEKPQRKAPRRVRRRGGLAATIGAVVLAAAWGGGSQPAAAQSSNDTPSGDTRSGTVVRTTNDEAGVTTFSKALVEEYKLLIREEIEKYDGHFPRRRYQQKIKALEEGKAALPDEAKRYDLKGPIRVALDEGRTRLMRALEAGARTKVPALAAKAQAKYDCWVTRAGARYTSEATIECQLLFVQALGSVEDAVMPVRTATVFNKTLAREYLAYADFESKDQRDYIDSRHFARKGLQAAKAEKVDEVRPEVLARWNLLADTEVPTFVNWRGRLIDALERHRTSPKARIAALAQVRFDCWVERTSERNDQAHVQKCRTEFLDYMRQLEGAVATSAQTFIVYFNFDRSNIRASERSKIEAAAKAAIEKNAQTVSVVGHTDRAGSEAYNMRLSFRRAEVVARALRRLGVRGDRIRTLYLGESQPRVPTADGVRNQENRRTEIVIR